MSAARPRALAVAAIAVAAAAGVAGPPTPRHTAPLPDRRPHVVGATPTPRAAASPRDAPAADDIDRHAQRRQARRAARTFVAALLTCEHGAGGPALRRRLARAATPSLARALRAAPARRPPGRRWPPPARMRRLLVIGPFGQHLKAIALLQRDGRTEPLELGMRRRGGRWRVATVG